MSLLELTPENAPFDGRWWFPGNEPNAVGGRLELEDERWTLRLFGWPAPWTGPADSQPVPEVVHGLVGGKHIAVWDLVSSGGSYGTTLNEVAYIVHTIVGDHIDSSELFDKVHVRILNLDEWAGRPGIKARYEDGAAGADIVEVAVLEATVPGASFTLGHGWGIKPEQQSVTLTSQEWLTVSLDEPADLPTIEHDWVRPVRHLIELGVDAHCPILAVHVDRLGDNPNHKNLTVLSSAARTRTPSKNHPDRYIRLDDFDFDDLIGSWWKLHRALGVIADLIASLREPGGYASNHFLNAASAAEGYHDRIRPTIEPDPDAVERKARLIRSTDGDDKAWLKDKLAFSLEPTFAARIRELVATAGPQFVAAIGDEAKWVKWVKDGRNSVAHRRPGMLDLDHEWRTTFCITQTLKWLLTINLLIDLGLSSETVGERVQRGRYLQHWSEGLKAEQPTWFPDV